MAFTYDFPRPGLTVDAVVLTDEIAPRILLIQRKHQPGAGVWALPGGFVNENENLEVAMRRELLEETGLQVGPLRVVGAFGDAGRDPRGWTVSIVYLTRAPSNNSQPPLVQASDDAAAAAWFALDRLPELAFDHATIVAHCLAVTRHQ